MQSLKRKAHRLSSPKNQLKTLEELDEIPSFSTRLSDSGYGPIKSGPLEILQINLGYVCNQTCSHCHVDAGPDRKESMSRETMSQCIDLALGSGVNTVDITGGAPEMHPLFEWLVESLSGKVDEIIVRSNLTIIESNKKYHHLPSFFAKHRVRVVSSLPFYTAEKTDRQRGKGVFQTSIKALERLNDVGYGKEDSDLRIDLVYNPSGAFLPGNSASLERDFKSQLASEYSIVFNQLLSITNVPISRYLDYLIESDNLEDYMYKLVQAFNINTLDDVMCKNTLSVRWDGAIFDCDFNQMLELAPKLGAHTNVANFDLRAWQSRAITTHKHCYGCTAGAGSSCQGTIV